MNKEDYKAAISREVSRHEIEKTNHIKTIREIQEKYVTANNSIKIGDVIEDHIGSIKVISFRVRYPYESSAIPELTFEGQELTKKLIPRRDGAKRRAYQRNIKQLKG